MKFTNNIFPNGNMVLGEDKHSNFSVWEAANGHRETRTINGKEMGRVSHRKTRKGPWGTPEFFARLEVGILRDIKKA